MKRKSYLIEIEIQRQRLRGVRHLYLIAVSGAILIES
jgi:hypothetical protein